MASKDGPNRGRFLGTGFEVAVGIGLGCVIGGYLDRKFDSKPWGLLIGAALGFVAGTYLLIKESISMNKKK